jgi:hypothetical protein
MRQHDSATNPLIESNNVSPEVKEKVEHKVELWKSRLIDLSLRNRLLNFRETKSSSTLRVIEPDPYAIFDCLVKEQAGYFIYIREQLALLELSEGDKPSPIKGVNTGNVSVRASDELVCQGDPGRTARVLYTLRSRAGTELGERGVNVLFVAIGFLHWTEVGTSSVQRSSPLILVPITLERERSRQRYHLIRIPEDIVVNPALALKLKNDFDVTMPELPEDSDNVDLKTFLTQVREATSQFPTWEVCEKVQIGLFSFLKFVMYRDLEASKELAVRHRIVGALSGVPSVPL